jgi:outer membrane protein OmpA-like peptidoglycan-associated protein
MRSTVLALALVSTLSAGVYDYGYTPLSDVSAAEKNNPLYYGDYERIIRYDAIGYTPGNPVRIDKEQSELDKMYGSIGEYAKANVPYTVSIIGHTRRDREADHERAQENTFFGSVQNFLMESESDAEENRADCNRAIDAIKKELMDRNVSEERILTECREGSQPLYLEDDEDARDRNYRVMVSLYADKIVKKPEPITPAPAKPAPAKAEPIKPAPAKVETEVANTAAVQSDSDGDGVVDEHDKCPATPKGYSVDETGCPRMVTLHINFATASAAIPASATADIEKLKGFMNDFPAYRIEINGHTDSIGSDESNDILSTKRAKALETILIKGGISADRIRSEGMGERKPIASNIHKEGRAQNRRTEVKLFDTTAQ